LYACGGSFGTLARAPSTCGDSARWSSFLPGPHGCSTSAPTPGTRPR